MNKLARLWDKFLTWPWWLAIKEAIEDKKDKKGGGEKASVASAESSLSQQ